VKKENRENVCQRYLADQQLHQLLEKVDSDFAQKIRDGGCGRCGANLHRSNIDRKPRGGPKHWDERDSFCCGRKGCRKRHTPPSVRFLGRKVYAGFFLVLLSAMRHGIKPDRFKVLREVLGVDRRTLEHWRHWWLKTFVKGPFWKAVRARFMPSLCEKTLPFSLCETFDIDRCERFLELLKFLAPITTVSIPLEQLI
jgi:hypothetical protein